MELTIEQALQQGVTAHKEGKLQDAERLYRAILQSQPAHPDANHNLGVIAVSVDKADAALPLFKVALEENPKMEQFWLSYIDALIKEQQFENAKQVVEQAKKQGVDGERLNSLKAQLSPKIQKSNTASVSPSQEQLNSLLGHYQNGRYGDAERLAVSITNEFPKHQFGWKVLGALLTQTGRITDSLTPVQKSVQLVPQDAEAHNNLGNTLKERGRLDEATVSYEQAIALKPDDFAKAYDNLGVVLQSNGKYEDAEICYKKYQSLEPNKLSSIKSRGEILFYQGDFEQALSVFDSYDNITSRGYALECLYCLGRIESIYERISAQIDLNSENIRVAAIAAFLTERTKKDTAHDFCNNPLDFIYVSNIASHIKDSNLFITKVIDELHNVKTEWEPNTTRNGFQASIDVFKNPLEKMNILKSIIIDELDSYYTKFKNESCSYITKWPSEKIVLGWHVILKQQGYQSAHIHPTGWLSGVIYLKNVPTMGKQEGAIKFSLDSPSYPDNCSSSKMHEPEVGDIVFFPSSLHHSTIPFTTDADRIIVSFDLMPEVAKS